MHLPFLHASPVVHRDAWTHEFGTMVFETCADGTLLIDGQVLWSSLPAHVRAAKEQEEATLLATAPPP